MGGQEGAKGPGLGLAEHAGLGEAATAAEGAVKLGVWFTGTALELGVFLEFMICVGWW